MKGSHQTKGTQLQLLPRTSRVDDPLMLLEEVAAIARCHVRTVRYWIEVGKLKAIKPGRRVMVHRSELERFLTPS